MWYEWKLRFLCYLESWDDKSLALLVRVYRGEFRPVEIERLTNPELRELGRMLRNAEGRKASRSMFGEVEAMRSAIDDLTCLNFAED